jgi:hypothetical protein
MRTHKLRPGGGGRSKFTRDTATGAVFKAADLVRDGWTGVHIGDETNQTYWPDRFHLVSKLNMASAFSSPQIMILEGLTGGCRHECTLTGREIGQWTAAAM